MNAALNPGETLRAGWHRAARRLFWLIVLAVSLLALWPRLTLPEPEATQGTTQYFHHVHAYLVLMLVGTAGWGLRRGLILGLTVYAILLELAQTLSPGRQTSLMDMLASLAGVGLGYAIARLILLLLKRRQHLPSRQRPQISGAGARTQTAEPEREAHGAPL